MTTKEQTSGYFPEEAIVCVWVWDAASQMALWWNLIAMEKMNMQRMEAPQELARVCYAYDQCLMCHFLYPEVGRTFGTAAG